MVPKSDHVTTTKIENLHADTWKNSLIPKMLFFSIYDENKEVIAEKSFRTLASPLTRCLAVLN